MPQFKLIQEIVENNERRWTYSCLFSFNFKRRKIEEITITDHFLVNHSEVMTKELILNIVAAELSGRRNLKPRDRVSNRDIYVREWIAYGDRDYRLIFWFKDGTTNHLWIRNCYPMH